MSEREILSLIIVEDEKIMLKELLNTIRWNELGIIVTATASDGEEGERLINETAPDIVLTDIKLPKKDGLEMVASCNLLYQNVIVLSGYTDFKYTRKAIQLGVYDYLEKPVDDEELENILKELSTRIREEHKKESSLRTGNTGEAIKLPRTVNNHQINCVIGFIRENYASPIGLSDAAEFAKLSENHLSTLFREESGINFLQYLNAYRINKAVELMKKEGINISEIAISCGFPTPGYFAKIFKRFLGQSPTQYRDSRF
ncbi:MAG: helix-turn-helix domain-containing protein [Sphaerochaetaceae bacterium]|nr:helix-turn-helix domain-containing protein [Sphaerochaetaceae bacterium]